MTATNPSDELELRVFTAWGHTSNALTIALIRPDEHDEFGIKRTLLMRPQGNRLHLLEQVPEIIHFAWQADRGTLYCVLEDGRLLVREEISDWRSESVCEQPQVFNAILGFSGASPDQDRVLLLSDRALFVRHGPNHWQRHAIPEEAEMANSMHGLRPDKIYITIPGGLLLWNGENLSEIEAPDEELFGILVVSDKEMYVTGDAMHRWTEAEGWQQLDAPVTDFSIGLVRFQDRVYAAALDGICSVAADEVHFENALDANGLVAAGDLLLAIGSWEGCRIYDGQTWVDLELPKIVAGGLP